MLVDTKLELVEPDDVACAFTGILFTGVIALPYATETVVEVSAAAPANLAISVSLVIAESFPI